MPLRRQPKDVVVCGIGGIVATGSGDPEALRSALRHRGPDGDGRFSQPTDCRIELVHTRLAILDLSDAGQQPMRSRSGRYVITYNGEIYNFRELAAELRRRGHVLRSTTDTEVLLEGWAEEGLAFLGRCRGMFAFAIWDREQRELWLVRDRLGIKPLYYTTPTGGLGFASEIRALVAAGLAAPTLDPEAIHCFLRMGAVHDPQTIVRGVRSLPPGSWLRWRAGWLSSGQYWKPHSDEQSVARSRADAVDLVRHKLQESVALRLVSDVPVGVLLSSGIDSSAIAALAAETGARPPESFTVRLDDAETDLDESSQAQAYAQRLGLRHHDVVLNGATVLDQLDNALSAMDQPTIDGLNTWFVTQAIRQRGLSVALSGLGGDEVFLGYRSAHTLARSSRFARRSQPLLRATASAVRTLSRSALPYTPLRLWKAADAPFVDGTPESVVEFRRVLFPRAAVDTLLPDVHPPRVSSNFGGDDHLGRWSRAELGGYLANMLLRDTDCFAMSHPVEVRVPLIDHELVQTVLSLEPSLRHIPGRQKPLLVDALGPRLPRSVARRPKQGFVLPTARWLTGPLFDRAAAVFRDDTCWESLGMDPAAVRMVWQRFLVHPRQNVASRPWALFALANYAAQVGKPLAQSINQLAARP